MKDNKKIVEIMRNHQSLTEWLAAINHEKADTIRQEDSLKRERLKVLNELIGLPFDRPTQFEATDLATNSPEHKKYLREHGKELCALRLNPKSADVAKYRMRGLTVQAAYEWFKKLDINPDQYKADYVPHTIDDNWSTMFIVSQDSIQGEIIPGNLIQLSAGFYETEPATAWRFDFKEWQYSGHLSANAKQHLKDLVSLIHVPDKKLQTKLKANLNATFSHGYLQGFFETSDTKDFGIWFKDYGPLIGELFTGQQIVPTPRKEAFVTGQPAQGGSASGIVNVVKSHNDSLSADEVMVCKLTTPDHIGQMQKSTAIVTDHGGILSHAAIVARELQKPCVVGTKEATKRLKTGWKVFVDADQGAVYKL